MHGAFEAPWRIIRQLAETPDGARYLCLATEIVKSGGGFATAHRRFAIALGCEVTHAQEFVYADGLGPFDRASFDPIGISCRICGRADCFQRAVPPLSRRLSVDHDRRSFLPYSFQVLSGNRGRTVAFNGTARTMTPGSAQHFLLSRCFHRGTPPVKGRVADFQSILSCSRWGQRQMRCACR